MHRLRGSPCIIVLLFYFACLLAAVTGLCPVRCECDDENLRVVCDQANLDVVPITLNPELRELLLANNHIKGIRSSFSVYRNLKYLDISHNQLVSLGKDNFEMQKHLQILLVHRNMISSLQNDTFTGLGSLQTLQLNENYLEELVPNIFAPLTQLERLDLSQNRIATISEEAFAGLESLKTLLLRDNKVRHIPTTAFQKVPQLLKLDLGLNTFQEIQEKAFSPLKQMQELCLDGCGIRTIQYGSFKWLNSLMVLRLQDNELFEVPTKALYDVLRLEEIHLGQNRIRELRPLSFQRLKFLRTVEISGSQEFVKVARGAFSDNSNLDRVVFNHNTRLHILEAGAFEGLPNLRHLSLRGNAFATLDQRLLPWDELEMLDVRDNPLVCNCSVLWLWHLLRNKNFTSQSVLSAGFTLSATSLSAPHIGTGAAEASGSEIAQVACANPPGLRNRLLAEVTVSDLDCYSEDTRRQIVIGVIVAAAVATAAMVMLGFRYRDKVAGVLKDKWNGRRKEPQYHKTNGEEESTILQAAQQSLKMTPVTEL